MASLNYILPSLGVNNVICFTCASSPFAKYYCFSSCHPLLNTYLMLFPIELHILKRAFDNMNILLVAVQARDEKQRELRREESEKENE